MSDVQRNLSALPLSVQALLSSAMGLLRLAEQEATHGLTANQEFIDQCVSSARKSIEEAMKDA